MKKYVTFNKYNDIFDVWAGVLEHDKDYIVIGYITKDSQEISSTTYTVRVGNKDVDINSSFFYPEPSREELLPSKVGEEEEESSFDNLVRSDYVIQECDYFVLNKLSEEQKEFLSKEFTVYGLGFSHDIFGHCYYNGNKFMACNSYWCSGKELSFNLLFVEKSS